MMLSALAILIGGTMIWRGRVTEVSNSAGLRRAAAIVNRQVLTFGVTLFAATLPALRVASDIWLVAALAFSGLFALVLFCMRDRWISRVRGGWEGSVQQSIRATMLPSATVHTLPANSVRLREAA
jgi:hypothetical protein